MHRRFGKMAPLVVLLATIGLTASIPANAQDMQHNETDIAFIKRLTAKLQHVEKQAERLEETIDQMSDQVSRNDRTGQDPFARQDSIRTSDPQAEYRRAGMKMRSIQKKAGKERDKLAELQVSGNSVDAADRDRVESMVSRMERDIANMEDDIRYRRFR
jgi:TolA-binding protein